MHLSLSISYFLPLETNGSLTTVDFRFELWDRCVIFETEILYPVNIHKTYVYHDDICPDERQTQTDAS